MSKEYRINGFEQIKAFYSWVFNNANRRVTPQHISLYLFLINQANRNNWVEWFKCPFDLAMTGACIGNKKTYYSCLSDLVEWELIQYEKGANEWKAPLIKLEVLKSTSSDTATVPLPEPLPTTLPTTLPTHIYKLLTDNLKRITDNIYDVIKFLDEKDGSNRGTYDFIDTGFEEVFDLWLSYKSDRKEKYKSIISIKTAYKHLLEMAGSDPETAMLIVKQSIANNWAGLFPLKAEGKQRKPADITSQELYELSLRNENG